MAINPGDIIIYVDKEKHGECVKGEIVDIWRNHGMEITDYFVALDTGKYTHVKPNYPSWCKVDEHFLYFKNNRLSVSILSNRGAFPVNV